MGIFDSIRNKLESVDMAEGDRYLSVSETVKLTGFSRQTLNDWQNKGKLTAHYPGGKPQEPAKFSDYRGKRYRLSEVIAVMEGKK